MTVPTTVPEVVDRLRGQFLDALAHTVGMTSRTLLTPSR